MLLDPDWLIEPFCRYCEKPAPLPHGRIAGETRGDGTLLRVIAPPRGWCADPMDPYSIVHVQCAFEHPDELDPQALAEIEFQAEYDRRYRSRFL